MSIPHTEVTAAGRRNDEANVHIEPGAAGGWDVTVIVDGRAIASSHCTDWHRTERVKRSFEFAVKTYLSRLVRTAATLAITGAALGVPAMTGARDAPDSRAGVAAI
jgi:hypothetical protein